MLKRTRDGFAFAALLTAATVSTGCAVTEPDARDTERVHAAIADGGAVSIPGLAGDLGISEAAVVKALPTSMRVALPADDLRQAFESACEVAPVRLSFPGVSSDSNLSILVRLQVDSLADDQLVVRGEDGFPQVFFDPADVVSIYLCRCEGMGPANRAILFFGSGGERLMTWEATEDASSTQAFDHVWARYQE